MFNKLKKFYKLNKKTINIFNQQVNNFNIIIKKNVDIKNNYNIGDDVIINEDTLIHGTRIDVNDLSLVKDNGLIAPEFFGNFNKNKKKPFVVEFWKINKKMFLKDFINNCCGVTLEVKNIDGSILLSETLSIEMVKEKLLSLGNYRDYVIFQNQEQRFVPNIYNKNSTMAFIVKETEENKDLINNDIFSENFDKSILKNILPKWFYKKYFITRNFDNYETGRERAIIYGVPSNCIEGILVNEDIEKDKEKLNIIKNIFPTCYICNINGKVIM